MLPAHPPKVGLRHTSRIPLIFSRSSTKSPDKNLLYKFSLNCLRGFLSEGLSEGASRKGLLAFGNRSFAPSARAISPTQTYSLVYLNF